MRHIVHGDTREWFPLGVKKFLSSPTPVTQNVGNSSQGLANGILFCAFTRIVRKKLAALLCCHGSSCPCRKHHRETVMAEVSTPNRVTFEDTEELLEESVSRTWEVQMPHSSLIPAHFHWGRGNAASLDAGGEYGSQSEAMYHGL